MINSCPNLTRVHCAELLSRGLGSDVFLFDMSVHMYQFYTVCDCSNCALADGVLMFYSIPNSGDFVVLCFGIQKLNLFLVIN